MFPTNCDGCYTFRDVMTEQKDTYDCLCKKVPKCPCNTCITKINCKTKLTCLDFLLCSIEYPFDGNLIGVLDSLESIVSNDLMTIVKKAANITHLNNMEG